MTIFVSGTFDLFDVMSKQHNRTALNPFLNGTENGDVDSMCKQGFSRLELLQILQAKAKRVVKWDTNIN